jgi:Protein of unknown function (DUF2490)
MRTIIILITFLFFNQNIFSQKSQTGNWFVYFGNQAINKKLNWHNEIQYRSYDFINDANQIILRTGLGYNLTDNNNNLLLGYGYILTKRYISDTNEKESSFENRIFQQYINKQNYGRLFFLNRFRIEERLLPNDFKIRYRYFLALNLPLNKPKMIENAVYFSMYNEIFINHEKPYFDRNRLYGAIGFVIDKNVKVELGYMTQYLEASNRSQFQIVIFNNLPF